MANIMITGATGMVGGEALVLACEDPRVTSITTLGRRATGLQHSKLTEVEHGDFGSFDGAREVLSGHDAALFCLGVYTGSVPDDVFKTITVDYTIAFAEAFLAANPGSVFCLLSGSGADPNEKSRISFARYKGMAENALMRMGFGRLHIFRPGYIYPVRPRGEPSLMYRVVRGIWPVLRKIVPGSGIDSDELARAMLDAALHGTPAHDGPILENRDIRAMLGLDGS